MRSRSQSRPRFGAVAEHQLADRGDRNPARAPVGRIVLTFDETPLDQPLDQHRHRGLRDVLADRECRHALRAIAAQAREHGCRGPAEVARSRAHERGPERCDAPLDLRPQIELGKLGRWHRDKDSQSYASRPMRYSITLRVRYAECDMQGHAFNGHYLAWFDMAHTHAFGEAVGTPTPNWCARASTSS